MWLSDIVPGLVGGLPAGVHLAELPNPTRVLDLAWIVSLAIGAARLLLRDHPGVTAAAARPIRVAPARARGTPYESLT